MKHKIIIWSLGGFWEGGRGVAEGVWEVLVGEERGMVGGGVMRWRLVGGGEEEEEGEGLLEEGFGVVEGFFFFLFLFGGREGGRVLQKQLRVVESGRGSGEWEGEMEEGWEG